MIKRLLKSVREFKKDALLTPFFVVLPCGSSARFIAEE